MKFHCADNDKYDELDEKQDDSFSTDFSSDWRLKIDKDSVTKTVVLTLNANSTE